MLDFHRSDYRSYLLRVWGDEARTTFHATLQSTATQEVVHFTTAEALLAFLTAPAAGEAAGAVPDDAPPDRPGRS